jgi:hypothetical protein
MLIKYQQQKKMNANFLQNSSHVLYGLKRTITPGNLLTRCNLSFKKERIHGELWLPTYFKQRKLSILNTYMHIYDLRLNETSAK